MKQLRPRALAVTAILGLALVVMGSAFAQPHAASPVTITEKDNGKTVTTAAGQTIIIRLPSNPTTGYKWMVQGSIAPLEMLTQRYTPGGENMPSAGGTQNFEMKAKSSGSAVVKLEYRRPWESLDVPPGKTFTVTVEVK